MLDHAQAVAALDAAGFTYRLIRHGLVPQRWLTVDHGKDAG
jgi:hypothetical protein